MFLGFCIACMFLAPATTALWLISVFEGSERANVQSRPMKRCSLPREWPFEAAVSPVVGKNRIVTREELTIGSEWWHYGDLIKVTEFKGQRLHYARSDGTLGGSLGPNNWRRLVQASARE